MVKKKNCSPELFLGPYLQKILNGCPLMQIQLLQHDHGGLIACGNITYQAVSLKV